MSQEIKDAIDKIGQTFEEYKKANDARIEAIKAGNSTSDMDAKLAKMDAAIDQLSEVKAKLESAIAQAPAVRVTDEMVKDTAKAIDDLHVEMTEASIGDEVATQFARAALEAAHGQGKSS